MVLSILYFAPYCDTPIMNLAWTFLYLVRLGTPLIALTLAKNVSMLSSVTFRAINASNQTVGIWPPHLPWLMPLTEEMSIEFVTYYSDAPKTRWDSIRQGLDELSTSILSGDPEGTLRRTIFTSYTGLRIGVSDKQTRDSDVPETHMTKRNMVVLLKLINHLFFVQENGPRGFSANVKLRSGQYKSMWLFVDVEIRENRPFLPYHYWPKTLPATIPYGHTISGLSKGLTITSYGKVENDPDEFEEIENALAWFIVDMDEEGPPNGLLVKDSFEYSWIKLSVDGKVSRSVMIELVAELQYLMLGTFWGPRELKADITFSYVSSQETKIGSISLKFPGRTQRTSVQ